MQKSLTSRKPRKVRTGDKSCHESAQATERRLAETPHAFALLGIYVNLPASYRRQLLYTAREIHRASGKDRRPQPLDGIALHPVREDGTEDTSYDIRPSDIQLRGERAGSFGKFEVEQRAGRLVMFFLERGDRWTSFSFDELGHFYRAHRWDPSSMFFGLMGCWLDDGGLGAYRSTNDYLLSTAAGRYCVTAEFIERCVSQK